MSNYHRYQEALTSAGRGTPLWEPSSTPGKRAVGIGDVGYLSFGTFVRLFNATLPSGHPDNEFGEPEYYRPLSIHPSQVRRKRLPGGIVACCGAQMTGSEDSTESLSYCCYNPSIPTDFVSISSSLAFRCTDKVGAVLLAEKEVVAEDLVDLDPFATYFSNYAQSWLRFATTLGRDLALRELIFVTGCDQTSGRYSATVFDEARVSKFIGRRASFQVADPRTKFSDWSDAISVGYFHHNAGQSRPQGSPSSTLFIRGFKILDRQLEEFESEEEEFEFEGTSHVSSFVITQTWISI